MVFVLYFVVALIVVSSMYVLFISLVYLFLANPFVFIFSCFVLFLLVVYGR